MSKQTTKMSRDQLQRIVRTIVLHDVSPQMTQQFKSKPVEVCRMVLDTLDMNVAPSQYSRKDAEQMVFDEIMGS